MGKRNMIRNPDNIFGYFKNEKFILAVITASGIVYNCGLLAGPVFQGKLIDAISQDKDVQSVFFIALLFVSSIAVVQIARAIKRFYVRRFANNVSMDMRTVLYSSMVHKTEKQLTSENMGSLMTKAVSDVDACVEGMRKFTTELFDTGVFLVAYLISLFIYDWKITLAAAGCIPIALFIAGRLRKRIVNYTTAWRKSMSNVADCTYDMIDNAVLYRIFGREDDNLEKYSLLTDDYEKKAVAANIWENSMMPIYRIIAMCGILAVVVSGAGNVYEGKWTPGIFSTYVMLFTALAEKASHAGKLFNSIQKAQVSWRRIKPFMSAWKKDRKTVRRSPVVFEPAKALSGSVVRFSDVNIAVRDTFGLHGIQLSLSPGQFAGITGPVACGKSMLGRIFLGTSEYSGSVSVCGRELSSISFDELNQYVSYMGHESSLMTDTIYRNITLGDDGDITAVLEAVCFSEDISSMEKGIQTLVGNGGVRLSGGQQERIALARTLYHRKPLIVLDDPFASVDKATETNIMRNIRALCADSAVLLISHRLSLFPDLDTVMLINADGTVESGTHDSLFSKSALYRKLFALQSGSPTELHTIREGEDRD